MIGRMEVGEILAEALKYITGGTVGTGFGYFAQKNAAKTEAVKDLQLLKEEYKGFAKYTREELELSRKERQECQSENASLKCNIEELNQKVNKLTVAMHNVIGTPTDKQKGLSES